MGDGNADADREYVREGRVALIRVHQLEAARINQPFDPPLSQIRPERFASGHFRADEIEQGLLVERLLQHPLDAKLSSSTD